MSQKRAVQLTPRLLSRPAAFAVRVVAAERLDACVAALDELNADAPDALHDLRVSLRRLRSWLRTFRPYVDDTVRRRSRRRLKKLVRATNDARDREVWSEWLGEQSALSARDRAGARYLIERLGSELQSAREDAVARAARRLPKIAKRLRKELGTYRLHVRAGADPRMSTAVADALRFGWQRLVRRIGKIDGEGDATAIHRTRIAAKKLRYVVETLEPHPVATELATALSDLQDLLGAVHDMQLLIDRIVGEIERGAAVEARHRAQATLGLARDDSGIAPPRRATPGLTRIASLASERARDQFSRYVAEWDANRIEGFSAAIDGLATDLEGSG